MRICVHNNDNDILIVSIMPCHNISYYLSCLIGEHSVSLSFDITIIIYNVIHYAVGGSCVLQETDSKQKSNK